MQTTVRLYTQQGAVLTPKRVISTSFADADVISTERFAEAGSLLGGKADLLMHGANYAVYGLENAADFASENPKATDEVSRLAGDEFDMFFGPILIIEQA